MKTFLQIVISICVIFLVCDYAYQVSRNFNKSKPKPVVQKGPTQADREAMQIVRKYGYKCDTYSDSVFTEWNGKYTLNCNDYRYTYIIQDVGGYYKVTVN